MQNQAKQAQAKQPQAMGAERPEAERQEAEPERQGVRHGNKHRILKHLYHVSYILYKFTEPY
jgi:hypothetical protein